MLDGFYCTCDNMKTMVFNDTDIHSIRTWAAFRAITTTFGAAFAFACAGEIPVVRVNSSHFNVAQSAPKSSKSTIPY